MVSTVISSIMGTVILGIIGWAFNLSTRVAVVERQQSSDKDNLKELFASKLEEMNRRLVNIESKLDKHELLG